ncbi:hypothetical protein Tco_1281950 [Tanacetum coccineum]
MSEMRVIINVPAMNGERRGENDLKVVVKVRGVRRMARVWKIVVTSAEVNWMVVVKKKVSGRKRRERVMMILMEAILDLL